MFFVALSRAKQRAIFAFCQARGDRKKIADLTQEFRNRTSRDCEGVYLSVDDAGAKLRWRVRLCRSGSRLRPRAAPHLRQPVTIPRARTYGAPRRERSIPSPA
jgi:hypothetical protein